MGRAGNRADHDVVEGKAKLLLLGTNLLGKADITKAAIFVDRGSRRDRIRLAAFGLHVRDRLFPTLPDTDVEPFVDHLDIGPHDPAQQDVADTVIDGVLMRHPAFLNQPAFHADFRRDSRHHARVVRLHPADRDQRIGVGGDRIGNDVFELAQLVAAESQSRITVLALGVEFDLAAQVCAEPLQLLDMRGSEGEWIAFEFLQHARCPSAAAPMP